VAVKKKTKSGRRPAGAKLRSASDDLRADARRNRDRLIEAAAPAFAEHGTAASLEEIARRAGVGIGTLYRHFPTREHLVEVVYGREVEQLIEAADELASNSALFAKASGAVPQTLQRLVEAAAQAGLIRKDIQSADLLQALSGLYSAPDTPDWRDRSRRLVGLLMDGLRTVPSRRRG